MEQNGWEEMTPEEKKRQLYENQKRLLDDFLKHGAITRAQYDKSLGDLTGKMGMTGSTIQIAEERLSAEEYIGFLKRTDLGSQYPKERFAERIEKLVRNVSVSLTARNGDGLLVGVLFGLTDYCYWLFVTDLGVDRNYERRGIATRLMRTAHKAAGGEKDIAVYLVANENAVPFYQKLGMQFSDDVMQYNHIDWTEWTVE